MEIIVTRSRIAGRLPHYVYRALVPADNVTPERRALSGTVVGPRNIGSFTCVRIAPLLAPERYFEMPHSERGDLASRIGALARRVETLIIRAIFPEMTAASPPIVFQLDCDPGDAFAWTDMDDLTGAFDRLEPDLGVLTDLNLGLNRAPGRYAA
ncbi:MULTISPECIES: hypothetical protein [Sphingomonadaceae]|jgi:hypothetical protein|uniref:hypothetical protein n=1 Tax=Sphingomonadales TaxID=204457 RepID=UPI000A39CD42|nr:hypothetical protein [Sphingobium sp. GW456-12-10-14-TSB1]OUC53013.1 hypothetical protein CA262_20770 [Sphingobium sp. GW456-12-10-14-TSB1]